MTAMTKITVAKAEIGDQFSIKRGRSREYLGTLTLKDPHKRSSDGKRIGWDVTFGDGGEIIFDGFAGGATVLLRHDLETADSVVSVGRLLAEKEGEMTSRWDIEERGTDRECIVEYTEVGNVPTEQIEVRRYIDTQDPNNIGWAYDEWRVEIGEAGDSAECEPGWWRGRIDVPPHIARRAAVLEEMHDVV